MRTVRKAWHSSPFVRHLITIAVSTGLSIISYAVTGHFPTNNPATLSFDK